MSNAPDSSATEDLIYLSSTVLQLIYGDEGYVRSVFGRSNITRKDLHEYYENAGATWTRYPVPWGTDTKDIIGWCRQQNVGNLHYYAPMGRRTFYFRDAETAYLCALRFG